MPTHPCYIQGKNDSDFKKNRSSTLLYKSWFVHASFSPGKRLVRGNSTSSKSECQERVEWCFSDWSLKTYGVSDESLLTEFLIRIW